jgi:hypothetical protein
MKPAALMKAALDRKSVTGFHTSIESRIPAAFLIGMPFFLVMKVMPRLKIYHPKKQTKNRTAKI